MKKVNTGLSGPVNRTILDSVLGQLSDGKWENSPAMEKFWRFADVVDEGGQLFVVVDDENYRSGFRGKDEAWVKDFFAKKIKQIVYDETGGGRWSRSDNTELDYLGDSSSPVTVSQAYKAYEILKGRNIAGRYAESAERVVEAVLAEEEEQ